MLKESVFSPFILPFRGLLYNASILDDVSRVICPPYDVIEDPKVYYERSPYNAVRLELPTGEDRYERAKNTLEVWLKEGIILEDEKDSIYVLEQEFVFEGKKFERVGFLSLVLLDQAKILTHERTKLQPKEDRKRLISKTKTFFSFIFGLFEDSSNEIESHLRFSAKEKIFEFEEDYYVSTKIYRISDRMEIERLVHLMKGKTVYLADGHHRLKVAYELNLGKIPIYLTNLMGKGLKIAPYHRLIRLNYEKKAIAMEGRLKGLLLRQIEFDVERVMRELEDGRFGVITKVSPDSVFIFEWGSKDGSSGSKIQSVHEEIIRGEIGAEEESIAFTPYLEKAYENVKRAQYDLAFLFPPIRVDEVKRVADSGSFLPPKSTYFFPKVPTGPIFYKYG